MNQSPGTGEEDPTQTSPGGSGELDFCNLPHASAQRLPVSEGGSDVQYVMSLHISGQDVFYSSYFEVYRVDLGDSSGASWEVLSTTGNRYFVTDAAVGLLAPGTLPADLTLTPRGGGAPQTQTLSSPTAVWPSQYDAASNSLYGERGFSPTFSYFQHDLATGQEQEFVTDIMGRGNDEWVIDGDDIIVLTGTYDDFVPGNLYSLPKGSTEATPLETGIEVNFTLLGVDSNYFYLNVLTDPVEIDRTVYRLPRAGGLAEPVIPDMGSYAIVHITRAGTFWEKLEVMGFAAEHVVYRIGPSAADAASPERVLAFNPNCTWVTSFATDTDLYVVLQPNTTHWLVRLPLADLL